MKCSDVGGPVARARLARYTLAITLVTLSAIALCACAGSNRTAPAESASVPVMPTGPCPLVTDADLAKFHPMLKRAGDEWNQRNGSIRCGISIGVDLGKIAISGHGRPPKFELLEVSVFRNVDIPVKDRLPKDLCTNRGYERAEECVKLPAVGDFAFYIKGTNGRFKILSYDGVRAVSGPYEIAVIANYWKGGDPRRGAIDLAAKLAARYQ